MLDMLTAAARARHNGGLILQSWETVNKFGETNAWLLNVRYKDQVDALTQMLQ